MLKYKITIADTPTSLNKLLRMHWAARKRIKERFGGAVFIGIMQSQIPNNFQAIPKKIKLKIKIYVGGRGRLPDGDNLLKHLFDLLVENGVLYDDSQEWLQWTQPEILRDTINPRTVVEIE